jgi:hypothetical protein
VDERIDIMIEEKVPVAHYGCDQPSRVIESTNRHARKGQGGLIERARSIKAFLPLEIYRNQWEAYDA